MKLKLCRSAIEALRCVGLPDAAGLAFWGAVLPGARQGKAANGQGVQNMRIAGHSPDATECHFIVTKCWLHRPASFAYTF
jgi:hypothetical protein